MSPVFQTEVKNGDGTAFPSCLKQAGSAEAQRDPRGWFCLSAFLVISNSRNPKEVLLGHLNPDAPWDHIGALDPPRVEMNKNGWLLPACHLIVGESPQEAAKRILKEQLELKEQKLEEPMIFSEVYGEHS